MDKPAADKDDVDLKLAVRELLDHPEHVGPFGAELKKQAGGCWGCVMALLNLDLGNGYVVGLAHGHCLSDGSAAVTPTLCQAHWDLFDRQIAKFAEIGDAQLRG
jgi:hypothetical protein